jgi:site-specific DNA recombinase
VPRAAIYVRVSTDNQGDNYSLPSQEKLSRGYCVEKGYTVDERFVYRETFTGENLFQRPQLAKMLEDMEAGLFDVIIIYAIDRFARKSKYLTFLYVQAEENDVRVESVTEDLDDTRQGWLMRNVKGYVAEEEHAKIKERMNRGRKERTDEHSLRPFVGGKPLWGYRWEDDKTLGKKGRKAFYRIIPPGEPGSAVEIIQRIYAEYVSGATIRSIKRGLEADRIAPAGGGSTWSTASIGRIVWNPGYCGLMVTGLWETKFDKALGRKVTRLRDRSEWRVIPGSEGKIEPMVTPAQFEAAFQIAQRNKANSTRSLLNPEEFLVRGRVWCAECGYKMSAINLKTRWKTSRNPEIAKTNTKHVRVYRCAGRHTDNHPSTGASVTIQQTTLDEMVWERVSSLLENPEHIKDELDRMEQNDPTSVDIGRIDRAIVATSKQVQNFAMAVGTATNDLARQVLTQNLDRASAELSELQDERREILGRREGWAKGRQNIATLVDQLVRLRERLSPDNLSPHQRRTAVEMLGIRAVVWPAEGSGPRATHDVRVEANIPLTPEKTDQFAFPTSRRGEHRVASSEHVILRWTNSSALPVAA